MGGTLSTGSALDASGPGQGRDRAGKLSTQDGAQATLYDAVLFDLDDTLIDRRAAFLRWARSFYDAQPAVRAAVAWEEASRLLVEWDDRGAAGRPGFFNQIKHSWPGVVGTAGELGSRYWAVFPASVHPDQRSLTLVRALREAGIPWGIVTNGGLYQRDKLRNAGLAGLPTAVVISEVVGMWKPAPGIFQHALRLIGSAPAATLFVGDNPEADIAGAAGVGMPTAWVRAGRTEYPGPGPEPDYRVDHVDELDELLLGTKGEATLQQESPRPARARRMGRRGEEEAPPVGWP